MHSGEQKFVLPPSSPMPEGLPLLTPPWQWVDLRSRRPDVEASVRAELVLDAESLADLQSALLFANSLAYLPDPLQPHKQRERWDVATSYGDCEDLCLAMREFLVNRGYAAGALRLMTCTRGGLGHAVLSIVTNKGDYVWCCILKDIVPWVVVSDPSLPAPYQWVSRWAGPDQWAPIGFAIGGSVS